MFTNITKCKFTIVPRLATLAPFALTRARATLPKLPSPISFITSNLSSNADVVWDPGRELYSEATVMAGYVFGGLSAPLQRLSDPLVRDSDKVANDFLLKIPKLNASSCLWVVATFSK